MINKNTKIFFSVASNPGNQDQNFIILILKKNINAIYLPLKLKTDFKKAFEIFKK